MRPAWSLTLYAVLVVSAGVALYAQRAVDVDPTIARTAPWLFLAFTLGFSVYRVALVVARRYSPFKAFSQIALAALFFLLLLFPKAARDVVQPELLTHPDARVRAQAAELAGWRGEQMKARALVALLADPSADVQQSAHDALVKLNGGVDLGASQDAWRARFP